jgi:hypothetical protein
VDPFALTALLKMPEWFTDERASALSLFELAHGRPFWDTDIAVNDGGLFIGAMAADSRVAMQVLLKEHGGVFGEVRSSLVDIGGSHGATAAAVAKAFPHVKCTVLDLPDVVAGAPAADDSLTFIAGDMFEYIPPADAVLLKVKLAKSLSWAAACMLFMDSSPSILLFLLYLVATTYWDHCFSGFCMIGNTKIASG